MQKLWLKMFSMIGIIYLNIKETYHYGRIEQSSMMKRNSKIKKLLKIG